MAFGLASLAADPPPRYVSSDLCTGCHAEIAKTYRQSAMAQTLSVVSKLPVIEDYTARNKLEHLPSGNFYELSFRQGRAFQLRYQKEDGAKVRMFEQEATHIIGSGRRARSYLNLSGEGELTQLPVSWYTQEKQWGMSPGYDRPKHDDFSRVVERGCLFCHSAYPVDGKDGFAVPSTFKAPLPQGIDCQRCHGPGSRHVSLAGDRADPSAIRTSIVNPKKLSPGLQRDVCLQCHLETTSAKLPHALRRFGEGDFSFRAGDKLTDHVVHFDHAPGTGREDKFEINSSGYRLRQSACFQKSNGTLTCTTCHDAHGAENPAKSRQKSCLQCHQQHTEPNRDDCASCHMPPRRAEDAVHVVITDHKIRRTPSPASQIGPLSENENVFRGPLKFYCSPPPSAVETDLYMGLALVTNDADVGKGMEALRRGIARGGARAPVEALVGYAQALAKEGRLREALQVYGRAIQEGPHLPAVRVEYAKALERSGQAELARRQYERSLKEDPGLASAQLGLGRLQANPAAAAELFRNAALTWTARADGLNNLGNVLASQQQFAAARASLEQALAIKPDFAEAENNLGRLCAMEGRLPEALKHMERALSLDDSYGEARFNYARLLHASGDRSGAILQYRAVLKQLPTLPEAHHGLGIALAEDGQLQAGIQEFLKVLALQPNNREARRDLELAREMASKPR